MGLNRKTCVQLECPYAFWLKKKRRSTLLCGDFSYMEIHDVGTKSSLSENARFRHEVDQGAIDPA
ncbi:MAG: hypothetical protein BBJ57_13345 [Desulfobacterales bacterium PC51MH44]|nr:MAG: hypothetical protein BBJ57_13345 [Desulfobacterales bacterium PC51MH44]